MLRIARVYSDASGKVLVEMGNQTAGDFSIWRKKGRLLVGMGVDNCRNLSMKWGFMYEAIFGIIKIAHLQRDRKSVV